MCRMARFDWYPIRFYSTVIPSIAISATLPLGISSQTWQSMSLSIGDVSRQLNQNVGSCSVFKHDESHRQRVDNKPAQKRARKSVDKKGA